ncbi:MAG: HAMP domain-containing histidine kinase [Ruminococcaceae bacterium]|nr:HAMP domain-containing histidine kinase [Oscillospiraceae bacterium]
MERLNFLVRPGQRRSLTGRWFRNAFGIIVIFLLLLGLLFAGMMRFYYHQGVQTALESRAELYQRTLELSEDAQSLPWAARSRELIAYFTDKDKMELQVLDADGQVLLSSTGFVPTEDSQPEDYRQALSAENGQGVCDGRNSAGESVMALTVLESDTKGQTIGALRYVVSLTQVNRQVWLMTFLLFGVMLLIVFFVALSGSYFINSIVNPVADIGRTARRIAMGEYDARLEKRYDDEIGDLCDTINFMAGEIGAAEKVKNEFISSVSHELRTPLTAIKGWSETLQASPEDAQLTAQGLAVIGKEADRLYSLVEELLDFSRMESGHIKLRREPLDVLAELEEAVFLYEDRARRAGIRLQYCEGKDLPPIIGDGDRLKQVFVNLLDNAVKYSHEGDRIRVEAVSVSQTVQIVISDTGIGIAEEELPRVRQKFYQVDPGASGSGLGLALVDEIVRLHGGTVDIDSQSGVGTTVTVTLPVLEGEE